MVRARCAIVLGALLCVAPAEARDLTWDTVKSLLADDEDERERALEALEQNPDPTLIAGLSDILYYHYVARNPEGAQAISRVMETITGERVADRRNPRETWAEWVGRHDEVEPKEGYLLFKRWLFEHYDGSFRGFFNPRFSYRIRIEEIEWGGVQKDGIPALDQPGFVAADDADYLEGDERVFGIELNGEAKAYPHRIMDAHEMCNDVVGGVHVSLSYCTLCGSGVLYAGAHASRDGKKPFTFGSSGLLYRSNKLMYDRPTNSLWSNLTGEPVAGRLADSGIRLERLPVVVTTWDEWRKAHPDTLVLDVNATGFPRDYSTSPYEGYFASDNTMFPVWLRSDALETKERVYALIVQGMPKAYPVDLLKEERITHDEIRGKTIVLLTNPRSGAVRAYESDGKRFALTDAPDVVIVEATGERWTVQEDALLSPGGEALPRIAGHDAFWFGWYAFFPTTEIYGR